MTTAMKKMASAQRALDVTSPPQVGPTVLADTWFGATPATFASSATTLAEVAACWALVCELRSASTEIVLPPSTWTTGSVSPALATAALACETVTPGACTSQDEPPLKSIPRLSPRTPSATIPAAMMRIEIVNHTFRRPTKSKVVWPR